MEQFTASNGVPLRRTSHGYLSFSTDVDLGVVTGITVDQEAALREFFQHERDEELGRWRWPEKPNFVVYAEGDGAHSVVNENTGSSLMSTRGGVRNYHDEHADAARAYFEAHPERKPWEDAKDGEIWLVNGTSPAVVRRCADGSRAYFEGTDPSNPWGHAAEHAESARRIWPVSDD